MMRIEQVNIGTVRPLRVGRRDTETGIYKQAVTGAQPVTTLGLAGDAICDTRHHGGPDQAVYLYSAEDYTLWEQELGKAVPAGSFGENLTVSGIDLNTVCVGDRLVSDRLALQVTAPRIPCNTLASRMGDRQFVKHFISIARSGAYCRVLREGEVCAGDEFTHEPYDGERISLVTFFHASYRSLDAATLRTYLDVPIDARSRADFEKQLKKLQ